jgi:hypothetical protein
MGVRTHVGARPASGIALTIMLGLVLAACGSTTPASPTAAPVGSNAPASSGPPPSGGNTGAFDVCGLLRVGDLERPFGQPMKVAQALPPGSWTAGSCAWEGSGSSTPASLTVMVGTGASMASAGLTDPVAWVGTAGKAAGTAYKTTAEKVTGVGDNAVYAGTDAAGQVIFCRRSTCAQVIAIGLGRDALIGLAKAIATNL